MKLGIGLGIPSGGRLPFSPLEFSPAAWFRRGDWTVTGSGISQWNDSSGNARHLLQGTDANRPISLLHSGENYLYLPGVAGNYASTPDSAANSITGDIDIRVRVALDDWTPTVTQTLVAKYGAGGSRSYYFSVNSSGQLFFSWTADGTTPITKTSTANLSATAAGGALWLRFYLDVDNGASGNDGLFYWAADANAEPSSWTKLGATVTTATATSIADTGAVLEVGSRVGGTAEQLAGKIYRAIIKNGIDGTTVVDFNAADATNEAASFASSTTGETWTVNKTGAKPAQIVGFSRILGDGSASKMATDAFTANQPRTRVMAVQPISWTAGDYLVSGTAAECGITQVTGTPQIGLNAGSAAAANAGLTLGAWHIVCAVHNGASSSLRVDGGAATTGNNGANNPGGIALCSNAAGAGYFNGMMAEYVEFPIALSAAQQDQMVRYMGGIVGLSL